MLSIKKKKMHELVNKMLNACLSVSYISNSSICSLLPQTKFCFAAG